MTFFKKNFIFLILICIGISCTTQKEIKMGAGMKIALTSVLVDDPIKAHQFYTEILGFQSKEFVPDAQLAVVVSAADPNGTALLLEPRGDSFAREYQTNIYNAGLPIIVFSVQNLSVEIERLKSKGVIFRDDLTKKEWGLENLFEDTCGNLIMLKQMP